VFQYLIDLVININTWLKMNQLKKTSLPSYKFKIQKKNELGFKFIF